MLISFSKKYLKMPNKSNETNKSNKINKSNKSIRRRKRGRRKRNSAEKNYVEPYYTRFNHKEETVYLNCLRLMNSLSSARRRRVLLRDNIVHSMNHHLRLVHPEINKKNDHIYESSLKNCNLLKKEQLQLITCNLQTTKPVKINWHRIEILCNEDYSRDYIVENLRIAAKELFEPLMLKISEKKVTFYIDNHIAANKVNDCLVAIARIGLVTEINPEYPPHSKIDHVLKGVLKKVICKRYDKNALNLSKFCHDSDLKKDYYCALYRPDMMKTVLDIVHEYMPTLEALNLEDNELKTIYNLDVLHMQLPLLKILYIGDNMIADIRELSAIDTLQLEELGLARNPLCDNFILKNDYFRQVRTIFPTLRRLDGIEIPAKLFDTTFDTTTTPISCRVFVKDAKTQEIANRFCTEYFSIFDSENRHSLLNAYDELACFSLTIQNIEKFPEYCAENRNLFILSNYDVRHKLLKQGRLQILSCITQLPRTKHHLKTFTVDINSINQLQEEMILIKLTGLFHSEYNNVNKLCSFSRTFLIVARGSGYCISNDQFHIDLPTVKQYKEFFGINSSIQEIANGFKKMEL